MTAQDTVSKKDFFLGFFAGMALTAIVCLLVIVFVQYFSGDKGQPIAQAPTPTVADGPGAEVPQPVAPQVAPTPIVVTADDHMRGNPEASITIVEYSDYQCTFCQRFHITMNQIFAEYENDVRWVYRHFPLDGIHPYARKASEAAECAADQDQFWAYSDALYAQQSAIAPALFPQIAEELGLNMATFTTCFDSGTYTEKVERQFQEGKTAGVQGTPGTFLNGEALNGAVPYATLKARIDGLL